MYMAVSGGKNRPRDGRVSKGKGQIAVGVNVIHMINMCIYVTVIWPWRLCQICVPYSRHVLDL